MIGMPAVAQAFQHGRTVGKVVRHEQQDYEIRFQIAVAFIEGQLVGLAGAGKTERDSIELAVGKPPVEIRRQQRLQLLRDRDLCRFDKAVADQQDSERVRRLGKRRFAIDEAE